MKVLTFSRYFPAYHPKAGQPTHFIYSIANSLFPDKPAPKETVLLYEAVPPEISYTKHHTIRSGNRWKAGDKFSPRIWSGKPYMTKQVQFAPPIQIKRVWYLEIQDKSFFYLDGVKFLNNVNPVFGSYSKLEAMAKNDGLTLEDFLLWFQYPKSFSGQIICWNDAIGY